MVGGNAFSDLLAFFAGLVGFSDPSSETAAQQAVELQPTSSFDDQPTLDGSESNNYNLQDLSGI